MLAWSHLHHHSKLQIHGSFSLSKPQNSTPSTLLHLSSTLHANPCIVSSSIVNQLKQTDDNNDNIENPKEILRRHNAKSSSLLLHRFSHRRQNEQQAQEPIDKEENLEESIPEEEKVKILELSLVTRRTPQFPGSVYIRSPDETSKPPLHKLFDDGSSGRDWDENDKALIRAIEIRRKVTVEIMKEAMRNGKFGITYSTNLISLLPDFIDHVMIEAAALKNSPEFAKFTFNARAKTFIDESDVVPLIRWLKHNSLSYPQIGKLICMSSGNLETIRGFVESLKSVNVKGRLIGVVLLKTGVNILSRKLEELDEIVWYLESNGVRKEWMGYVISRCPQLLSCSFEELKSRVGFYLDMGMNNKDFGTMVYDYPRVLGYFSFEEMNQKVNYLREFGLGTQDIGRLLAFKPQLMGCSIEERWKPLVKYFYYLRISRDGMRRILMVKPIVFCVHLETTIVPKVQFLQDIGIRDDAIGSMLVKFPQLMTHSLYKKIRPVVIFLMTKAGVSQRDIGKVIALAPELLGCSIANKLEVTLKYFLSLGISLPQLGNMIADFPMLLRYNVDVLRPKYRYLRRVMIRPLEDVIEFPRFFSYSLDGRIIPRHKAMVDNRVNFKLRYMLASTDEEFAQKVEAAVERRQKFEAGFSISSLSNSNTDDSTEKTLVHFDSQNAIAQ